MHVVGLVELWRIVAESMGQRLVGVVVVGKMEVLTC